MERIDVGRDSGMGDRAEDGDFALEKIERFPIPHGFEGEDFQGEGGGIGKGGDFIGYAARATTKECGDAVTRVDQFIELEWRVWPGG